MELRKKVKIRFEMFSKTILDKQGNESYIFSQQEMNDFLDSFENLAIPDVVHSKTPPKYAVVGCGDSSNIIARRLAEKGFETILVNADDKEPLTLKDIRPPVDIEPLILENTLPDNPFYKPQNRAEPTKTSKEQRKEKE